MHTHMHSYTLTLARAHGLTGSHGYTTAARAGRSLRARPCALGRSVALPNPPPPQPCNAQHQGQPGSSLRLRLGALLPLYRLGHWGQERLGAHQGHLMSPSQLPLRYEPASPHVTDEDSKGQRRPTASKWWGAHAAWHRAQGWGAGSCRGPGASHPLVCACLSVSPSPSSSRNPSP